MCTVFQPNQLSCRPFVKIDKILNIMGFEELHFGPKFEFLCVLDSDLFVWVEEVSSGEFMHINILWVDPHNIKHDRTKACTWSRTGFLYLYIHCYHCSLLKHIARFITPLNCKEDLLQSVKDISFRKSWGIIVVYADFEWDIWAGRTAVHEMSCIMF